MAPSSDLIDLTHNPSFKKLLESCDSGDEDIDRYLCGLVGNSVNFEELNSYLGENSHIDLNNYKLMNNFHIYEEVGRGKYSVVYKVIITCTSFIMIGEEEEDY